MKLYDDCLAGIEKLLESYPPCKLDYREGECSWPDAGKNQLIFRNDMAYELGGGALPAVSTMIPTGSRAAVPGNEIWLCGKDLPELKEDTPYARLALVRVREGFAENADARYQMIRKIEYTKYHLNPTGYMIRISAVNQRESVRIGKGALGEGLNFSRAGSLFLQAYQEHPAVEAVKLVFITRPDFPYKELAGLAERAENITRTLDHLLKKVRMDCNACGLQEICAQVEELYQKEFGDQESETKDTKEATE